MRQNILGILQSLRHLHVRTLHCCGQGVGQSISFLVHIGYNFRLARQDYLSMILEIYLNDFIR